MHTLYILHVYSHTTFSARMFSRKSDKILSEMFVGNNTQCSGVGAFFTVKNIDFNSNEIDSLMQFERYKVYSKVGWVYMYIILYTS